MSVPSFCNTYRILIVEDEARLAAFIEKGLCRQGLTTAIAADGEQAIQMALSDKFDLMLLDLGLPILDGLTVLRTLRHQHQVSFPIIVVSALDDSHKVDAVMAAGANDYVTKPFRFHDLWAKIQHRLNLPTTSD
ncbi:MAG: response regulator transcription factor [Acaryochloris sp. RU_4_1]|nr:response regulator transcription factor [Acaryochloris sp. RU_4_1]